jgi:hypothetical protein
MNESERIADLLRQAQGPITRRRKSQRGGTRPGAGRPAVRLILHDGELVSLGSQGSNFRVQIVDRLGLIFVDQRIALNKINLVKRGKSGKLV